MKSAKVISKAKSGQFVLTSQRGEKFGLVEGLHLSERMAVVVRDASGRSLSGDQRRTMVKAALRSK